MVEGNRSRDGLHLLTFGQSWPPGEVLRTNPRFRRMCYLSAEIVALATGLRYCERFALADRWVHHAWVADEHGRALEVTWYQPARAYYGVVFPVTPPARGVHRLDLALGAWPPQTSDKVPAHAS